MLDNKKKRFIASTIIINVAIVCLLSASLGTDWWVNSRPERVVSDDIKGTVRNVTDIGTKFQGKIHFGLFRGTKLLDSGFGTSGREVTIWVLQLGEHGLFNYGLLLCTIIFIMLAIIWSLVSMGFAIFNISARPIETITGPVGLYLWNSLGGVFSFLAIVMYLALYFKDLRQNVLNKTDRENFWTSKDRTWPDYSFYLTLVAMFLYIINIVLIFISGIKLKTGRFSTKFNEKTADGSMMY